MDYNELGQIDSSYAKSNVNSYIRRVFLYMAIGLIATALIAAVSLYSGLYFQYIQVTGTFGLFGLLIAQFLIVIFIQARLYKSSYHTLLAMFICYSMITGFTMPLFFMAYGLGNAIIAFGLTSVLFLVMSTIGYLTKADLTKYSTLVTGTIITLVIVSVVNWFLQSSMLDTIICYAGVLIFAGITAYDVNKIKITYDQVQNNEGLLSNLSVIFALHLYLDFINMFIYILRILGRRK